MKRILFPVLLILLLLISGCEKSIPAESADTGRTFLTQLESGDPSLVDATLKQQRIDRMNAEKQSFAMELDKHPERVWSYFDDYVMLGDSRAVGFWYYNYLPESHVLAYFGDKIIELEEHLDDVKKMDPATIFLCYGVNDVGIGIWPTPESYVDAFRPIILEFRSAVPEARIFLSSILPTQTFAYDLNPVWEQIPDYNAALKAMCDELDQVYFVDNDDICREYEYLYESDGIHVTSDFYPYWARNLITAVFDAQVDASYAEHDP